VGKNLLWATGLKRGKKGCLGVARKGIQGLTKKAVELPQLRKVREMEG